MKLYNTQFRLTTRLTSVMLALLFALFTQTTSADGEIDIKTINVTPVTENNYKVNGDIVFQLTDTLREALTHGVTLKSHIDFNLGEHRSWWWNSNKTISKISYELKYHSLSKHYVLKQLKTEKRWSFTNLPIALKQMGRLREHKLPTLSAEIKDGNHYLYITAVIAAETRSLPFKIQNYFKSSKYQIKSEGVLWALP